MRTYTYSEARQRLAAVLDRARREGRVQIRRQDGTVYAVEPVKAQGSPLDVPGVETSLKPGELTRLLRQQRKDAGEDLVAALSNQRLQPTKARRRGKPSKGKK